MDRNEVIARVVSEIKRKSRGGTYLGLTRSQRYNIEKDFYVTFNVPVLTPVISELAYVIKHRHLPGQVTHNIVLSEKMESSQRKINRRVRLKFWKEKKNWACQKIIEEFKLTGEERDWAHGDADFPDIASAGILRLMDKKVLPLTDSDLRKLLVSLEVFEADGTWEETFLYDGE